MCTGTTLSTDKVFLANQICLEANRRPLNSFFWEDHLLQSNLQHKSLSDHLVGQSVAIVSVQKWGKKGFLTSKSVDIVCEGRNQTEMQDFQPRVNGDIVPIKKPYMVE